MTNETPETGQPTPPIPPVIAPQHPPLSGGTGGHGFGSTVSSDPAPAPSFVAPGQHPTIPYLTDPSAAGQHPAGYAPSPVPPYGAVPGAAPRKGLSKGALFGIIGGAVAVVLLIVAAIVIPAILRGPAVTASDVVEQYLTAVSEGDADTALTFVDAYGEDQLLTAEVLAASLALAPIGDIEIGAESPDEYDAAVVPVTFSVGGETVSRDFQVFRFGDEWEIVDGLVRLSGLTNFDGLDLTVNGVSAPDSSYAFPGTYELALGREEFTIGDGTTVFPIISDDDSEVFWELRPELSEEGAATFREMVRASLEECVAMKTFSTPCGMDISGIDLSGATPVEGTVTRTLTAEGESALNALEAESTSGAVVTTYDSIDVDMTLEGELDGARSEYEVWFGGYLNTPKVDFAAETPVVVWE